jgi:DNA-binding PadR family transcriptional regulator
MSRSRRCSPQALRLLGVLLQEPQAWRHGYGLSRLTGLKAGTVYPLLRRLGERGLLESRWEASPQPGRPTRQGHRLTAAGIIFVRSQQAGTGATR